MADTAAHLADRVFPLAPVRQCVLSLPFALRYRLAYDVSMLGEVLAVLTQPVFGSLRRRAREVGIEDCQCGAVTFIQRFGGSLNLNVHFHMLALDRVYAGLHDKPAFFPLRALVDSEVARLVEKLADRIPALLKRRGLDPRESDPEQSDPLARDEPWLAGLYADSVTGKIAPAARAGDRIDPESMAGGHARCASLSGFSLHANVAVPAHDRLRLERLFRYAARPPLAIERLEPLDDGRLLYRFKQPWRDGTTHIVLTPEQLIETLAALVPAPRTNLVLCVLRAG